MERKKETPQDKRKKHFSDRLLAIPGINEAIYLVRGHAWGRAVNEAIDLAEKGELGETVKRIISKPTDDALNKFLNNRFIKEYVNESYDEWLEIIAVATGPKIAELWSLSEAAGQRLAIAIYWGDHALKSGEAVFSPIVILANAKGAKETETLKKHQYEFRKKNVNIIATDQIQKGHIYLDVTELTYSKLRSAYKVISLCRNYLQVKKKDLQAGAPSNIDTQKALEAIYLKNSHKSSKSIAGQLGFNIYSSDNPSGSHPLLHKYFKIGKDLEERLIKLDKFLSTVTVEPDHELST